LLKSITSYVQSFASLAKATYIDPFDFAPENPPTYEVKADEFRFPVKCKVAGYCSDEIKSVEQIYDLMVPEDKEFSLDVTTSAMEHMKGFVVRNIETRLDILFRMKGKDGKLYCYHRKGIINGVFDGRIASNFTYLDDVTWMQPTNFRQWRLGGPGGNIFDFEIPEIRIFEQVFTLREFDILKLLARGFSSNDIARALKISKLTVDTHRRNMRNKVDVSNTAELLFLAKEMKVF